MKCIVNDGKDAVNINDINRYCYEHYQIYDTLLKLYHKQVDYSSNRSLSWKDFLANVLDTRFTASWKVSITYSSSSNGNVLDIIADVAKAELSM
ncbi:MAG TPA: hypothetical protein VE619_01900 [Nitrososphaeraceae archaeon]|nr:hypothetical protein [Nitrososphaeraceae archaeon]